MVASVLAPQAKTTQFSSKAEYYTQFVDHAVMPQIELQWCLGQHRPLAHHAMPKQQSFGAARLGVLQRVHECCCQYPSESNVRDLLE